MYSHSPLQARTHPIPASPPAHQSRSLLPSDSGKGGVEAADHLLNGLGRVEDVISLPGYQVDAWRRGGGDCDEVQEVGLCSWGHCAQVPSNPPLPFALLLVFLGLSLLGLVF